VNVHDLKKTAGYPAVFFIRTAYPNSKFRFLQIQIVVYIVAYYNAFNNFRHVLF